MIAPELQELEADLADLDAISIALERHRLEDSLYEFMREAWHVVEPSRPLVDNWHIRVICRELERVTRAELARVIINIAPGTLKSLIVSVFWPAWMWARNPRKRVLAASYGQHLSMRDNVRTRDLVTSEWFQSLWPVALVDDQNTKTRYDTTKGGWRIATSVGGVATGEHPHIIIIDDPLTAQQARSDTERAAANDWFDRTISSRGVTSNVAIVVIMQRLHEEDLTGHLLKKGGWELIRFPMRYVPTRPATRDVPGYDADPRDPRRTAGELMCPQVLPEKKVRQLELDLGPYSTAGQLQQTPVPEGGGLFQRAWFKFTDAAPARKRSVRGWDTAGTEGAGDWTVGVKVSEGLSDEGRPTGIFFVEDVQREQLSSDGVEKLMKNTAFLDGRTCAVREEKEGGSAGKAVIAAHTKLLNQFDYQGVHLGADKVTRAKPFRAQVEAGNVYLVRAPWNERYIQELCTFPTGKHDDQVDGSSTAYNALVMEVFAQVRIRRFGS